MRIFKSIVTLFILMNINFVMASNVPVENNVYGLNTHNSTFVTNQNIDVEVNEVIYNYQLANLLEGLLVEAGISVSDKLYYHVYNYDYLNNHWTIEDVVNYVNERIQKVS